METASISVPSVHVHAENFKPNKQQQSLHWKCYKLVSEISEHKYKSIFVLLLEKTSSVPCDLLKISYIYKRTFHVKEQIKEPMISVVKMLLNVLRIFEKLKAFQIPLNVIG